MGLWGAWDSLGFSCAITVSVWWNLIQTLDRPLEKLEQILEGSGWDGCAMDATYSSFPMKGEERRTGFASNPEKTQTSDSQIGMTAPVQ